MLFKSTYKKYTIKIPKNVLVIYSDLNGYLLFKKDNKVVFIKTLFRINFLNNTFFQISPEIIGDDNGLLSQKEIKKCLNTQVSLIKKHLADVLVTPYKKLIFVGLGYKFFLIKNHLILLQLKLGYSHDVYIKVPSNIDLKWHNQNSIYVSGSSTTIVSNFVNKIKEYKIPDPYIGKGILFANEKIILKKGKQA